MASPRLGRDFSAKARSANGLGSKYDWRAEQKKWESHEPTGSPASQDGAGEDSRSGVAETIPQTTQGG